MELRIRHHPTLNCLCRSDGAVFVFGNPDNRAAHWTFGSMRGNYLRVTVENKGRSVHRVIAETFCENPENKPTVDHINRIKTDNRAENLRFATRKEQQANRDVNYTVEWKLKTRTKTEFSEWYWNTYHMFKRDNLPQYLRDLRFYKKHGCFPVRGG